MDAGAYRPKARQTLLVPKELLVAQPHALEYGSLRLGPEPAGSLVLAAAQLRQPFVVESPGGISPPGALRTEREPLDSLGSSYPDTL